jgi:hypothetical protein
MNINTNNENLGLVKGFVEVLDSLPKEIRNQIFLNFFSIHKEDFKDVQISIWKKLSNKWQDDRTTDEIIDDIYNSRTLGREFQL